MKVKLEDFGTGWFSATVGMTENDVDTLIENLQSLKAKKFEHFVVVNNSDDEKSGLENIEFYLCTEEETSNASILGGDIKPTRK